MLDTMYMTLLDADGVARSMLMRERRPDTIERHGYTLGTCRHAFTGELYTYGDGVAAYGTGWRAVRTLCRLADVVKMLASHNLSLAFTRDCRDNLCIKFYRHASEKSQPVKVFAKLPQDNKHTPVTLCRAQGFWANAGASINKINYHSSQEWEVINRTNKHLVSKFNRLSRTPEIRSNRTIQGQDELWFIFP